MKKNLLFVLLAILCISFMSNLFAQVTVDIGTGTATNSNTGAPAPYGTWYKAFRQQFLVTSNELYDLGAAPGFVNAVGFNVASLDDCTPMNNYRIRIKHTNQAALNTTFEVGDYTEVFQAASFMPTDGWNMHTFSEGFFWDGASNLLIDIVTDVITSAYARNALTYMTDTGFSSSLRYNSDSASGTTGTTGTISQNRSNMRFIMDIGDIGSLSGTVVSGTTMLSDVLVTVEDTAWSATTNANGEYSIPVVLTGDYQVTAHKVGYEEVTLPVTISVDEESVLNFNLPASTSVDITGTIVGSDNPTVGLNNATVLFAGPLNYEVVTNAQGQFSVTVLSGNAYNYTIMRDGYQATTGTINVGSTNYDMGTITIAELTLPPGPVFAELNSTESAVELTWSPPGGGSGMFFDFEYDDGGWEPSSSGAGDGDWEYTDDYDVSNFVVIEYPDNTLPPQTAYSGTGMWGTKMYENYSNSASFSYLSKTFDFSSLSDATMRFMSYENVYGDWDYCQVSVNGTVVWGPSWEGAAAQWTERIVDLSAYDGMSDVTIRFELYATSVVAYGGWYIDDVEFGMASQFGPATVSAPSTDLRYAGLSETEAANLAASEAIRSPHNEYNRRAIVSSRPSDQRIPVGYKVWRLILGEETQENLWTELTTATITDTVFTDPAWPTLPNATYKWAVRTVYTNNVLSDPRFSNTIRMEPNDLSALEIFGSTTPPVNSPVSHTVVVKNTGTAAQDAGSYTVKIMQGTNELASGTGPALAIDEEAEIALSWTPTATGPTVIHGLVTLPGDTNPANDQTPPLELTVMDEGTFVVQLGDGTAVNTETGAPAPYGTYWKAFRQQFLYKADEIYALGGAPGLITALAFDVQNLGTCSPMPNYRIRLKHTAQDALNTTFEAGDYQEVFQAASYMPTVGWNIHGFTQPFIWNGSDNILVDIVTDVITGSYTRNAHVYYSVTPFSSSLRFQSDTAAGDTGTTGSILSNRSNTRFFLDIEDMGSLSGTVTDADGPLAGASVVVENTVFSTETDSQGNYAFPYVPVGAQTVTASLHGYANTSHNVTIIEDENTVQDFVLVQLPQVSVSGRIVGSDAPTVGIADAMFSLSGYEPYSAETDASGNFTIPNVYANHVYTYNASAIGYAMTTGTLDVGTSNINMGDIIVNEVAYPPHSVIATEAADYQSVDLTWESPVPGGTAYEDDFEDYAPFATEFGDWVTHDVDGLPTYGFSGIDFPGSGSAMSFIIFTPNATTPPLDEHPAYSGENLAACFASQGGLNNDWLISPQVLGGGEVSFWAKTYMDYGLERFHLGVSTTGTEPGDFTIISGPSYIEVPLNWTEFTFDLSDYAGQQIHVGINCVSDDCFIFWVDDFYAGPSRAAQRLTTAKDAAIEANHISSTRGTPVPRAIVEPNPVTIVSKPAQPQDRAMLGYKVYRLLADDQDNEAQWATLTTNTITAEAYNDASWGPLPAGVYKYAVKSVYTNDVMSPAAFSQELHKGMMGTLEGTVYELGTDLPIEGVTITAGDYSGVTDVNGEYAFAIYAGTYEVSAAKTGYETMTETGVVIAPGATVELNFVLNEITLPVAAVEAVEAGNNVNITWMEPGTAGGEWIHYDSGENDDAIGTGGAADFDVAIRFPASALQEYAGTSLHAVKVWPNEAACTYSIRVWTGGSPTAPGQMVVDQTFAHETAAFNIVVLDDPVMITGQEELWFGMRCNTTTGWPAGCDAGPATEGFGNMMFFQGEWDTLNNIAPGLDYNWNIQGYVGYAAPDRSTDIALERLNIIEHNESRALEGYQVWRLLQGQETNEAQWTSLTPAAISATAYQDTGWGSMPDGFYRWAVRAEYTGGALSIPAFSNTLERLTEIGTLAGFVRNEDGDGIANATITSGNYDTTTNAQGAYSLMLPAGSHTVTASHPSYASGSQSGIIIVTGQTTNLDFILEPTAIVFTDDFEGYPNFAVQFAPWILHDVDGSGTYGFSGIDFPGTYDPMSYIIFNPGATTPPVSDMVAHSGDKYAACFAATAGPNNDWLITPQVPGGGVVKFWAKTFMDYGLERMKIGVSTTGSNTTDFTFIHDGNYVNVPLEWTEYEFDLGAYADQMIHIAINCVSDDCFVLKIDDVEVHASVSTEDETAPVLVTELKGNYPNPFNPETTINFSVQENGPVSVSVYNVKGQLVRNLVNDVRAAGNHSVVWNGKDNNGRDVSSGVYYFKMNAGKYSSTKKMVLMK